MVVVINRNIISKQCIRTNTEIFSNKDSAPFPKIHFSPDYGICTIHNGNLAVIRYIPPPPVRISLQPLSIHIDTLFPIYGGLFISFISTMNLSLYLIFNNNILTIEDVHFTNLLNTSHHHFLIFIQQYL